MRAHIVKAGNHLVVVLPDSFCDQAGLSEGSPIDLDIDKDGLTIRPVRYGVGDLIARLTTPGAGESAKPESAAAPAIAPAKVRTGSL
ncbi:MAG: AbrB/MazE/SpoVT family DNA-binding domain-containing protein [Alphaproteobacteria bacterium]